MVNFDISCTRWWGAGLCESDGDYGLLEGRNGHFLTIIAIIVTKCRTLMTGWRAKGCLIVSKRLWQDLPEHVESTS